MAGRGPSPASTHTRKSNDHQVTRLVADGQLRGMALPRNFVLDPKTREPMAWHPATRRWWDHWRKSPQATRMLTQPDWDFLLDTALMHHWMWTRGNFELAGEVRLRVQQFGATPEARQRLRVDVTVDRPAPTDADVEEDGPTGNVSSIDERRQRLA
ncbi:hypothetical protein [Curtobacterium sp. VKM Ac-2884]|jgi:hypothetical protein|uniref:phage terminase small subunit n=1 Tax=Curtobacterium sp. VKM Ac-2884 TaxID=2783818 RepID=UPI001E3FDBDA|nr:hypothetical protein [Curtobacterium sp. VKM Ac-2884]